MNKFSLYVHIPFCDSKCYYCDFNSGIFNEEIKTKYFKALKNEIKQKKLKGEVQTIYFGGGTPSSVDERYIVEILNLIYKNFNVKSDAEITIEGNPNSLTFEKLIAYFKAGFNRISIGVQTLNKKSLKFIGRVQNDKILKNYQKSVQNAIKNAKKAGFSNISADLMLGLPLNNKKQLIKDLKFLVKNCTHISSYMLMLEEKTPLFEKMNLSEDEREEKATEEYKLAYEFLKKNNFERYEISNFAKENKTSKHNINYWQGGNYLGFGLSAHSLLNLHRFSNTYSMEKYLNYFENLKLSSSKKDEETLINDVKKSKFYSVEKLNKKMQIEEKIMLSLRRKEGLNLLDFKNQFYDLRKKKSNEISLLLENGFITGLPEKIILTDKGFFVANQIILKLI